ncbi:transposase [Tritonibacter mobilis]|uniref:transposase n=1 Tax=Tritonibacter mobilis TaxID=379347 RepID=UPI001B8010D6
MKTAVIGESTDGVVIYNASLVSLLTHYDCAPRACQPYRTKTKGKVEHPFRYIRQDFILGRTFRKLDDLNAQFEAWRMEIANPRVHATTQRIIDEAFAEERLRVVTTTCQPLQRGADDRAARHQGRHDLGWRQSLLGS